MRADRRARIASRAIGLFVALLSFAVAGMGVLRYFNPRVNAFFGSRELLIGVLLVVAAALGIWMIGLVRREWRPVASSAGPGG
jgi:hypothetical protein